MKLNDGKFWIVTDWGWGSEWVDIFSGPHNWKFITRVIMGRRSWGKDNEAVYDNEREARKDAEARWKKSGEPVPKKAGYDRRGTA